MSRVRLFLIRWIKPTLALKPRGDVTRSPKPGYQWPHKKDSCPPKILKKKDGLKYRPVLR